MIIERAQLDFLVFAQDIDTHQYPQVIEDSLEFIDLGLLVYPFVANLGDYIGFFDQIDNPQIQIVQDYIGFQQSFTSGIKLDISIHDILSFGQSGCKVKPIAVFDNLFLKQFVVVPIVQTINFIDVVIGYKTHAIKNVLTFTQTCKPGHIAHFFLTDIIPFVSDAIGVILDVNFIAINLPPFQFIDHIILRTDTDAIRLRNPQFGDIDKYEQSRVVHHSRGLDLSVYQDPLWPTTEVLSYNFKALHQGDVWALMDFYQANLGQNIILTDYHGNNWIGVLMVMRDIAQEGIENFIAGFDFQGVPVPANIVTVNQALSFATGGVP